MVIGTHSVVLLGWSVQGRGGVLGCTRRSGLSRDDIERAAKGCSGLSQREAEFLSGDPGPLTENGNPIRKLRTDGANPSGTGCVAERANDESFAVAGLRASCLHRIYVPVRDGTNGVSTVGVVDGAEPSFDVSDDDTGGQRVGAPGVVADGFPGG